MVDYSKPNYFQKGNHPKTEWKKGQIGINNGKQFTKKWKEKLSQAAIKRFENKKNHPRWIEDKTKLQKYGDTNKDRRSSSYNYWRLEVYKRDKYKCKIENCDCSGRIIAHHILSYTDYPELRYNINNGITLCQFHHPRKRVEEQKLIPVFTQLVEVIRT